MLKFEMLWFFALLPLPLIFRRENPIVLKAIQVPFFTSLLELSTDNANGRKVSNKSDWRQPLLAIIWLLLVVAMAKPVWLDPPIFVHEKKRDFMVVVDISSSMQTVDESMQGEPESSNKKSRLQNVKAMLETLLISQKGSRFGLIVYGSSPYLQIPFTADQTLFQQLLASIQVGMAGPKTMIGDAIGLAIKHFEETAKSQNGFSNREKVLLLISDGNDTGSAVPVREVAQLAADKAIKIHTILIGNASSIGENAINKDLLKLTSEITGGKYFSIENSNSLREINNQLLNIIPQDTETVKFQKKIMLYHWPMGMALLIVLFTPMLFRLTSQYRPKLTDKSTRFEHLDD